MKNKPDLFVTLTIIYLALLTVCIAIYAILQLYVKEIDRGTATNLMIWSATLFPSIALLYTFNSWKDQKSSEILSEESKLIFKFIHSNYQCFNDIFKETAIYRKEQSYQYVRDNYLKYIENLNLYNSLIFIMKKQNTEKEFKEYMKMLDNFFKNPEYNKEILENNKDYIFKCSENLEKKLVSIILHLDD